MIKSIQYAKGSDIVTMSFPEDMTPDLPDGYVEVTQEKPAIGTWTIKPDGTWEDVTDYVALLESDKASKIEEVKTKRKEKQGSNFSINGVWFHSDYEARLAYQELRSTLELDPGFTTRWKAMHGVWVDMDAALFASILSVGQAHLQQCFEWEEGKQEEVESCTTSEEVNNIILE